MTIEQQFDEVQRATRIVQRVYTNVGLTFAERLDLLNITAALYLARR